MTVQLSQEQWIAIKSARKWDSFADMLKRLFLSAVVLLCSQGIVWAEAPAMDQASNELIGRWQLTQTFCSDVRANRVEPTRIMKMPWLGFEPNVQLNVFETLSGKNIEKVVPKSSCENNEVSTTHFIRSTYAIHTRTNVVNDQPIHTVTSRGIVSKEVNEAAIKQCGGTVKGFILNTVISNFIYPDYFQQEAKRTYEFMIKDWRLFVLFTEPMICETGHTVMVFGRR
ncbi:MAG: hypothetical protein JNM24_13325 [Bdellovibrionaceae bacterium]|nr:hypothetical protein [Pseudobdellovibrionaceae bacterium]